MTVRSRFPGRILFIGFGSVGQGVLPMLFRQFEITADQISIITADERGQAIAAEYGVSFKISPLTPENYQSTLNSLLKPGDFLLNVSVDVSSLALLQYCHEKGILYLDTCIEPWKGGYTDTSRTLAERSNYALRESMLAFKQQYPKGPTAIVAHGANPGLVSHFVKEALLNIAKDEHRSVSVPQSRDEWANLARQLNIRVIHIAERDTQRSLKKKAHDEFVNTWSVDGFVSEGCQPAELGWGSHEQHFPNDGHRHAKGCKSAIYLDRPGAATRVRSWTPLEGPFHGFLITHNESISISDYFSLLDNGKLIYRPTVHYAYHPCDDAVLSLHELAGKNWEIQEHQRILKEDIVSGIDELGVLLMGHQKGSYWYGSRLSIEEARGLAPHNNATSLQVTSTIIGGIKFALDNPHLGVLEADEINYEYVLNIAKPFLGEMVGVYSDWTPLKSRGRLFNEVLDKNDPWQFVNFRVV